jgi:hypothetical protein
LDAEPSFAMFASLVFGTFFKLTERQHAGDELTVMQRTHEISLRMTLNADRRR